MTNESATFAATAIVAYVTDQRMGIVFTTAEAADQEFSKSGWPTKKQS
jgi:hypothetical protein